MDLERLTDDELLGRLERFVEEERERLHEFLAWLGEADRRGAPEKAGYASTFDYCVRRLKLHEGEAYRRIHAARAAVLRPSLLAALADGQLSLSAVSQLAPLATRPDADAIISRAEGKSTREIEALIAPLKPVSERRDVVRRVDLAPTHASEPPRPRAEFSFQAPAALRDAVERARALLAHRHPDGRLGDILLEIVEEFLERHDPQRSLAIGRGDLVPGSGLPISVRKAVWSRDRGRCAYVGPGGIRCGAVHGLELDHIVPRSRGGSNAPDNLRLLCRAHNQSEMRRLFPE